eukprot:1160176-Pelagomonas_calceolata.AAC.2
MVAAASPSRGALCLGRPFGHGKAKTTSYPSASHVLQGAGVSGEWLKMCIKTDWPDFGGGVHGEGPIIFGNTSLPLRTPCALVLPLRLLMASCTPCIPGGCLPTPAPCLVVFQLISPHLLNRLLRPIASTSSPLTSLFVQTPIHSVHIYTNRLLRPPVSMRKLHNASKSVSAASKLLSNRQQGEDAPAGSGDGARSLSGKSAQASDGTRDHEAKALFPRSRTSKGGNEPALLKSAGEQEEDEDDANFGPQGESVASISPHEWICKFVFPT